MDGQATLGRLDAWYAYYHRHWWCRRRQFTRFKRAHLWWNGLALLLMASGVIVGPVLKNSWVVAGLAAVSTLVKGWIDFRNVCQNLDRIANVGAQRGGGGPSGVFGQDANLGRHGDGFCATFDRHLSEGLRGPLSLSPSPFYKSDRDRGGAHHTRMPAGRRRRHGPKRRCLPPLSPLGPGSRRSR